MPLSLTSPMKASYCLLLSTVLAVVGGCQAASCGEDFESAGGLCVRKDLSPCGECEAREYCDTSTAEPKCECVPGYEGESCAFVGLVEDPGFQTEINVGPWRQGGTRGATIDNPGGLDSGEARIANRAVCDASQVVQTVRMPSYALGGPLVVDVNYQTEGVSGLGIGFGRAWKRLPPSEQGAKSGSVTCEPTSESGWTRCSFCLGEAAHGLVPGGSDVEVAVSSWEKLPGCSTIDLGLPGSEQLIRVDRIELRPATSAECVPLGAVNDGDLEAPDSTWTFLSDGSAEAAVAPRVGENLSDGARIARAAGTDGRATMSTRLSIPVPATLESPALVFWWRGSDGGLFDVELGTLVDLDDRGRQIDTLSGTSSGTPRSYCLPPWTHGSELDLSFSLRDQRGLDLELVVDSVRLVSDPSCGVDTDLLDPGFEAPNRWPGVRLGSSLELARPRSDGDDARSGSGWLQFEYGTDDVDTRFETYVWVPEPTETEGPALFFFSTAPNALSTTPLTTTDVTSDSRIVATASEWTRNEICLPSEWAGRWFPTTVEVSGSSGVLDDERLLLDDFSLDTSSRCPP